MTTTTCSQQQQPPPPQSSSDKKIFTTPYTHRFHVPSFLFSFQTCPRIANISSRRSPTSSLASSPAGNTKPSLKHSSEITPRTGTARSSQKNKSATSGIRIRYHQGKVLSLFFLSSFFGVYHLSRHHRSEVVLAVARPSSRDQ